MLGVLCRLHVLALPPTFVFLQWCAYEATSCPRHKTLDEDINFGLHVTAPLKKHFVVHSGASRHLDHDLSQVVRYFSLTSPSPLLEKRRVVSSFTFLSRPLRFVAVRKSDKMTTFCSRKIFVVQMFF